MKIRVDVSYAVAVEANSIEDALDQVADMYLPSNYIEDSFEATVDDEEREYVANVYSRHPHRDS